MKHVRASILAEEIGFTPRHWIRLASKGMLPGAYQPSGPGGQWMFDWPIVRHWAAAQGLQLKEQPARPLQKIKKPRRAIRETDTIYFCYSAGLVKIGISNNFRVRSRSFKTASPVPIRQLLSFAGNFADECALHQRFEDSHSHGEWFKLSPALRTYIVDLADSDVLLFAENEFREWLKSGGHI